MLIRDRIVAADAGLTRLYMALRATLAVGLSLGLLTIVSHVWRLPLTVPLFGAAISMMWTVAVNDPDPRAQRIVTLALWLPAAAMVSLGTLTAKDRTVSDVLFVLVLFCSVYVRRFGPRGFAAGMISVLTFFFSIFLRATLQQLPWLLGALAVSAFSAYTMRFWFFPDDPQLAVRTGVAAFRARQRLIAATLGAARARGWKRLLRSSLNHHTFRLNETAVNIDDVLKAADADEARIALLLAEIRTQRIAERALRDPATPRRIAFLAIEGDFHAQTWAPRQRFNVGTTVDTAPLRSTTRQAIQLTIAAAAAIVLGEMLSPVRWYWAVLAAFVVFSGTSSSGETVRKASARIAGTALGVLAGIGVGSALRGHQEASFVLIFVFLFAAIYTLRLSYVLMIFFVTGLLSMLYAMMGLFSDQLMVLRLEETLIGAALGAAAAMLVLPIPTKHVVANVFTEAVQRLAASVEAATARLHGDESADPLGAVRAYDEAFQTARAQLLPIIAATRLRGEKKERDRLLLLAAGGYYARRLAIDAVHGDTKAAESDRERVDQTLERLRSSN